MEKQMERILRVVVAVASLSLTLQESKPQIPTKLPVVDEALRDPSLLRVRDEVRAAAKVGDMETLWSHISKSVQADDEAVGIPALKRRWKIDRSPGPFLRELHLILTLGGGVQGGTTFVAPAMYVDFGDETVMPNYIVVIHQNAPVFQKMDVRSPVVARCSDDVFPASVRNRHWTEVTLHDGRNGFMRDEDVRQPQDMRVNFTKQKGVWMITGVYGGVD